MSLRTFLSRVLQLLKGGSDPQPAPPPSTRPAARAIRFSRLEDRRVFNASFVLNAAGLTLDNFTSSGELSVSDGPGDVQFRLGSGMGQWIGATGPGISLLDNGSLLSVQDSLLQNGGAAGNISILADNANGDINISLNDAIHLQGGSTPSALQIQTTGNVLLARNVIAPNAILDAPNYHISVTASGLVGIEGIVNAQSVTLHSAGDAIIAGRIDAENSILVDSAAEILDGQNEQISFRTEQLTLKAVKGIGNADTIETDVRFLQAFNLESGQIDITETGAPGNLTIGRIDNPGRFVRLQVMNGGLVDGNDAGGRQLNIDAHDLQLETTADIGSPGTTPFPLFRNHLEVSVTGDLTAQTPGFAAFFGQIDGQLNVVAHDLTLASDTDVDFTRAGESILQGVSLIADADGNGSGTVLIAEQLSMPESLLLQGADIQASDGTIDLQAGRILLVSGQSEELHLNLIPLQTGELGQFDGTVNGNLSIVSDSAVALADLDGSGDALRSLSTTGSLNLTIGGRAAINGKVTAADSVTIAAADDLDVFGPVSAGTRLRLSAGSDGTGSLFTSSTSFIEAGGPGQPGDLTLNAGDQQGNIQLNGTVKASQQLTASAPGGHLNGSAVPSAPMITLTAGAGIGNLAPLQIMAADVEASTGSDGIFLKNSIAANYRSLTATTGDLILESAEAANVISAVTGGGNIRLTTAAGQLLVQQAVTESGDISLRGSQNDLVLVGNVIANGLITVHSATAVAEFDSDEEGDLQALQIEIYAATGIGTAANPIEVAGPEMTLAAATGTGDIRLNALQTIVIGSTPDLQGLMIRDPDQTNQKNTIALTASDQILLASGIENRAEGNIELTAGAEIFQDSGAGIFTGGSGSINITAGLSQQTSIPGSFVMNDGAIISNQMGQIRLVAGADVALGEVHSQSGNLYVEAGSNNPFGSIVDNSVAENPNLSTSGILTLLAATNVGGPDTDADLNLQVNGVQAAATTGGIYLQSASFLRILSNGLRTAGPAGDIHVVTTSGGLEVSGNIMAAGSGRIQLITADELKVNSLIASETGDIFLTGRRVSTNNAGNIQTGGSGALNLTATDGEIVIDPSNSLIAQDGGLVLQATGNVVLSELRTAGNVTISSDTGNVFDNNDTTTQRRTNITGNDVRLKAVNIGQQPVDFFTGLPEALDVSITGALSVDVTGFAALQGRIATTGTLSAETLFLMSEQNLNFATLNPSVVNLALLGDVDGNADGTVFLKTEVVVPGNLRITAADLDGGTDGIRLLAENLLLTSGQSESARVTLNAPGTGEIGVLDARSKGSLQLQATTPVQLRDLDGDTLALASTASDGDLVLNAAGTILVQNKLQADGLVRLSTTGDLSVNAPIDPDTVTLTADGDILLNNQIVATQQIVISAGADGDGNLSSSAAGSLQAGSGNTGDILLRAGDTSGSIELQGPVNAGAGLVLRAVGGSVNAFSQLTSRTLQIDAATGIGNQTPLQVQAHTIAANTLSGNVALSNSVAAVCTSLTTSAGSLFYSGTGSTDVLAAVTDEGEIQLQTVGGNLTIGQVTATAGSVLLSTFETGSVLINSASASTILQVEAAESIAEVGADNDVDLQGQQIGLRASTGIGSAGQALELDGPDLQLTAYTDTGDIRLQALSGVTVSTVIEATGLTIRDRNQTGGQHQIELVSNAAIFLEASVVNNSLGDIQLLADGDLQQFAFTSVRTAGLGTVTLRAGKTQGGSVGSIGRNMTMEDESLIDSDQGSITLQATGDVRLGTVHSASGRIVASAGTITSIGSIFDNTLTETANLVTSGSVSLSATDNVGGPGTDEDVNFDAPRLEAVSNFGSLHLRSAGTVQLEGQGLRTFGATGNIHLVTDAGNLDVAAEVHAANAGNIRLEAKDQLTLSRLVTSQSGFITLNGASVAASADGDVSTAGNGSIVLNAFEQDILLDAQQTLVAGNGLVSLQANRHISIAGIQTAGNVAAVAVNGDIFDNNDETTSRRLNITAASLTLTANAIGTPPDSFFVELPNGLEIDLTGTLTVQAQTFAALHGNINGTGNLTAQTLFLMSDQDLVYSTAGTPQVTNLALLADLDNNGAGAVVLRTPVAVSGNLRLSGHDIDGGVDGIRLTGQRMLLRSGSSEDISAGSASTVLPLFLDAATAASLRITAVTGVQLSDLNADGSAFASSGTTGQLNLTAGDTIHVVDKIFTAGSVNLNATGQIVIDGAIDPETITLTASDDIQINNALVATHLLTVTAGTDGTGSISSASAGTLTASGPGNTGEIRLISGEVSGAIQLHGRVESAADMTITAAGGAINGTAELLAKSLRMTAATGIGNLNPLNMTAGNVAANTANGDLLLQNRIAAVYTSLSTGTGLISVTTAGLAEFQNVQTSDGDIRLFSESAAIFVDNVKAGSTDNTLRITSETLSELNSDSAADLTASHIILLTNRGIGSVSNALELSGSGLQLTAGSQSGSIVLTADTTVEVVAALDQSGLQTGTPGQPAGGNGSADPQLLSLTTTGSLLINADVRNFAGGDVLLQAGVQIQQQSPTTITATDSGSIQLQAIGDIRLSTLQSEASVEVRSQQGSIVDNNDSPGNRRTNVSADSLLLQAISVGQPPAAFFTDLPEALEVSLTGALSVDVAGFAAIHGTIGTTSALRADTLFLISDEHLNLAAVSQQQVNNFAAIADLDRNGSGTINFSQPVAVAGNLRLQAADLDAGAEPIRVSAQRTLATSQQSELLLLTPLNIGPGTPGQFDGVAGDNLTVSASDSLVLTDLNGDGNALSAAKTIHADSAADLQVAARITTTEEIQLRATRTLSADGALTSRDIFLRGGDINVTERLAAARNTILEAGPGGVGGIRVSSTGQIQAGNPQGTGSITLRSGSMSGDIQLDGLLQAGHQLDVTAGGGRIDGTGQLAAPDISLHSANGIGGNSSLQLLADRIEAETSKSDLLIRNLQSGTFARLQNLTGNIDATGDGDTLVQTAFTSTGNIRLQTAAGQLTIVRAVVSTAGDIRLSTTDTGSILIGRVGTPDQLVVSAASAVAELGSDSDVDLAARGIAISARSGIGTSANSLELQASNLAAQTQSGDIRLDATDSITVSTVDNLSGLRILDPTAPQGTIRLTSANALDVATAVMNDTGGDIQLLAGTNLRLQSDAAVVTAGQGSLLLVAGFRPPGDQRTPLGSITQSSHATISSQHGNITLTAADDVLLDQIVSVDGNIFITAGAANPTGHLSADPARNDAHIRTAGFVSLKSGAESPDQWTSLTVDVGGLQGSWQQGNVIIRSFGDLTITGTGLSTTGATGDIFVVTEDGSLRINSRLASLTGGAVTLSAGIDLSINAEVQSAGGPVNLQSAGHITLLSEGRIATIGQGAITLNAGDGSLQMQSGSQITSVSGDIELTAGQDLQIARVSSQTGVLNLRAIAGQISDSSSAEQLNLLTDSAIWLRAGAGIGGSSPEQDLNLQAGRLDAVSSSGGIWLTAQGNLYVTRQGLVSAGNNATIQLNVSGRLRADQTLRADSGNLLIAAAGITTEGAMQLLALEGDISLQAGTEQITMSAATEVRTHAGSIRINAASDIRLAYVETAGLLSVASTAGALLDGNDPSGTDTAPQAVLNLQAGEIRLAATAGIGALNPIEISTALLHAINSTNGVINLVQTHVGGDLALDLVDNADRPVQLAVLSGALTDGNDQSGLARLNLQAGAASLTARDGIGSNNPLETRLGTLNAFVTNSGSLRINESDHLAVQRVQVSGPGDVQIATGADLLIQDQIQVLTGGGGSVTGTQPEIRLTAISSIELSVNSKITTELSHNISLLAGNDVTMQTGSLISSSGGELLVSTDQQTGGDILVQNLITTGRKLTVQSAGNLRIGDTAGVLLRAADGVASNAEQILLDAAGNIRIADGTVISTDDDPNPGASVQQTADRLVLIARGRTAGSNLPPDAAVGRVEFDGRVVLRTDGGVATTFLGRPTADAAGTIAFFDSSRAQRTAQGQLIYPGKLRPDPNGGSPGSGTGSASLQLVFELQVSANSPQGQPAEENLRLDIDWRDPSDTAPTTLYVDPGSRLLAHSYSVAELLKFLETGKSQFLVDFSVSHHNSIRVFGAEVRQGAASAAIPVGRVTNPLTGNDLVTGLISSSDSAATGSLQPGQNGGPRDIFSDPNSDADFHFDGAVVRIQVPVSPFGSGPFNGNGNGPGNGNRGNNDLDGPPAQRPPRRAFIPLVVQQTPIRAQLQPRADFEPITASMVVNTNAQIQDVAAEDSLAVTEDTYEVRQSEQGRFTVLRQLDRFDQGEELLNPQALKAWVQRQAQQTEKPLLDGEDYELWLVTKKRTASGAVVRIERQLLMFDVIEGQPFPARDDQSTEQSAAGPQLQPVAPEDLPPQPGQQEQAQPEAPRS